MKFFIWRNVFLILLIIKTINTNLLYSEEVQSLTLTDLIERLNENPEVRKFKYKLDSAKARALKVTALPDPMIEFGLKKEMDMYGDSIMFQQTLPYPGKLSLTGEIENKSVEIIEQEMSTKLLQLRKETKMDYYDLFLVRKEFEVINAKKKYLENMVESASIMYTSGMSPQTDILKAQTELSMLKEKEIMLAAKAETLVSKIERCCLGLPFGIEIKIEVADELRLTKLDQSYKELQKVAFESSPMLKMYRIETNKMESEVKLMKKEYSPDFVTSLESMNPDKSLDSWSVKIGIMYPLYKNKKQKNAVREAENNLKSQEMLYENERQMLAYNLSKLYLMAKSEEKLLELYKHEILAQLQLTVDSAITNYKTGKLNFMTVLDNIKMLQEAELKYYEQLVEHEKAIAEIEEIVGRR